MPPGTPATGVPGFSLVAEDGNSLPGVSRVQSEVFLAAGKTYDVMVNAPTACTPVSGAATCTSANASTPCTPVSGAATCTSTLPVYDRQLSLSANSIARDAGMLAYIGVNDAGLPTTGAFSKASTTATANADHYFVVPGHTLTVSDPAKGVIANDTNVYGVRLDTTKMAANGMVTLNANGTFTYVPSGTATSDSFGYCANGTTRASTPSVCATVTLGAATIEAGSGITCPSSAYPSTVATTLSIKPPGILAGCKDAQGYPLTVNVASVTSSGFTTLSVDPNGGFNASVSGGGSASFTFQAQNSQGTLSTSAAIVTVTFPAASGLQVQLVDGATKAPLTGGAFNTGDYRWIIEEDRTFYVNPACTTNPPPAGCPSSPPESFRPSGPISTPATCRSWQLVAPGPLSCESGQTLLGQNAVCDVGNGVCRTNGDATDAGQSRDGPSGSDQALLHLGSAGRCGQPVREPEQVFE